MKICCCRLFAFLVALSALGLMAAPDVPRKIIFDTDMVEDYDDVGAMALLHALADEGRCEILAMGTCTRDNSSVAVVELINAFYGRPEIPVGCAKEIGVVGVPGKDPKRPGHQKYVRLAREYAKWVRHPNSNDAPDANAVYRRALASAPDGSVVFCSVGFVTNMRRLLESKPDAVSPLDGKALVAKKVCAWYAMAGSLPNGREYNVEKDAASAKIAFAEWPTPIVVSDFGIGRDTYAGRGVTERDYPYPNPVKDIFSRCLPSRAGAHAPKAWDRDELGHTAWDETTVLAAVFGATRHFDLVHGRMAVDATGRNSWTNDATCAGGCLKAADARGYTLRRVGEIMDAYIARPPACRALGAPTLQVVTTDPLAWLYAHSRAADVPALAEFDVPSNGVADVNVLIDGLDPGLPVEVSAKGADGDEWYRLRAVTVPRNTGRNGFLERTGQVNPYVTRRAPFSVYDVLEPLSSRRIAAPRQIEALRLRYRCEALGAGDHRISLTVRQGDKTLTREVRLRVHAASLPPVGRTSFKYTNWLNLNNMASRHGVAQWSEGHWQMIERYVRCVATARQNMLLVPSSVIFEKDGQGAVGFARARFERLLAICDRAGIWYLEGPHLAGFTAGWSSPTFHPLFSTNLTTSVRGQAELRHLAGIVRQVVETYGLSSRWYQHVADEPSHHNAGEYVKTAETVRSCLPGVRITDAVEKPGFESVVDVPCPKVDMYERRRADFATAREKPWCYTCCVPGGKWMNRLMDGELLKPTLLSWVCTITGVDGFLHWGGNQYQKGQDPFRDPFPSTWKGSNDGNSLPPGDTHVIYPGGDGPWMSARLEATRAGMEDADLLLKLRASDPARAEALVRRIARGFCDYSPDILLYRQLRRELLDALDAALSDPAPRTVLDLPPGEANCRNSEGDFAVLKDGSVLFAYSHYVKGSGGDHDPAYIASRVSKDGGRTWSAKSEKVIENEGGMNVMCASFLRLKDGSLALVYLRKNSEADCRPMMRVSKDEGRTWGAPVKCIADADVGYYVLENCRAERLRSGRIILPMSLHESKNGKIHDWAGKLVCAVSDDDGATWRLSGKAFATCDGKGGRIATQEPGIVQLKDGRLLMYARTDRGRQWFYYSSDDGNCWTKGEPGSLWGPLSPATVKRLSNGDLVAVWNDHEQHPGYAKAGPAWAKGTRRPISIAVSKDEGRTWIHRHTLEDVPDGWYCYFGVVEHKGDLLLGFCAEKMLKHTRLMRVPIDWIYAD